MHEYGIAQSILDGVLVQAKKHQAGQVHVIRLKIGQFNLLTPEALRQAFAIAARGTPAENASLEIEETPGMEIEIKEIEAG